MNPLSRLFRRQPEDPPRPDRWLQVSADDLPDPDERARYELAINTALRQGGGVLVEEDETGATIDGRHFDSVAAATAAAKGQQPRFVSKPKMD